MCSEVSASGQVPRIIRFRVVILLSWNWTVASGAKSAGSPTEVLPCPLRTMPLPPIHHILHHVDTVEKNLPQHTMAPATPLPPRRTIVVVTPGSRRWLGLPASRTGLDFAASESRREQALQSTIYSSCSNWKQLFEAIC